MSERPSRRQSTTWAFLSSFHLKELKNARVVSCRREGRSLVYAPEFGAMDELLGFLTANCCQGVGSCDPPAAGRRRRR